MSTDRPKLIGLYSPAPQSGKSTAAAYLEARHGYVLRSFARPLKEMLAPLLVNALGLTVEQAAAALFGEDKNKPLPIIGKTARQCLQTLGTEWGRGLVSESIWTDIATAIYRREGNPSVFDDMRFPNEMKAIRDAGGVCICIVRPGVTNAEAHASEGALNGEQFDAYIVNGGTVEDLERKIDLALLGLETAAEAKEAESRPTIDESSRMCAFGDVFFRLDDALWSVLAAEAEKEKPFEITGPGVYRRRDGGFSAIDSKSAGLTLLWRGEVNGHQGAGWDRSGLFMPWQGPHRFDLVEGPL